MASTIQTKHNPDLTRRAALTRPSGALSVSALVLKEERSSLPSKNDLPGANGVCNAGEVPDVAKRVAIKHHQVRVQAF